jgi:hypothetical protein
MLLSSEEVEEDSPVLEARFGSICLRLAFIMRNDEHVVEDSNSNRKATRLGGNEDALEVLFRENMLHRFIIIENESTIYALLYPWHI